MRILKFVKYRFKTSFCYYSDLRQMKVEGVDFSIDKLKRGLFNGTLSFDRRGFGRILVSADLFLVVFNKDCKRFWRQGKPLSIKKQEVLILNSSIGLNSNAGESYSIHRLSAKTMECYLNEHLCPSVKRHLPLQFNEWPELLLREPSPLVKELKVLPALTTNHDRISGVERDQIFKLLKALFISIDVPLFKALSRLKDLRFNSRQELLQKVARVNCYLRENLNQDLSLEAIASLAGYSHYHFQRQYKLATGLSPTKQLRIWRLEAAVEHLTRSDIPVSTIAELVGYKDLPTFSKAFKQHFGRSPSKYLKNNSFQTN
jgi:AraC-like DNA-binding protein